ncbi:MAG TPA: helix-turn-helix domain-containing protein [Solirubrobacterales bacterium]|nr:helix-turn-helix domain-containing protein [Solirubrobacterales bacterium]
MIAARLRGRRSEIEQATLTRVYAVSEPPAGAGPEYLEGLRVAVSAAIEYGLGGIERGEQSAPPVPDVLLAQARLAARSGVSLDTVLRRYVAGHTLIDDFMVEEAELFGPAELKRLLRCQAAIVDRLLAAVSTAYNEEAERRPRSAERRRAELVARLLGGEPLETRELDYDFDLHHLGCVLSGPGATQALAQIAKPLDARLLSVRREEGTLWAWLGSRRPPDPGELVRCAERELPEGHVLAIGEPGEGISGWRLTHRQARAVLPIAQRGGERVVRYSGAALLASALQDELLRAALRNLYLAPLEVERDGGAALRRTLRAYFAAERNVSSTATSMEADRKTVTSRLRAVERRLGRPIVSCAPELETALRLEQFAAEPSPDTGITPPQIPKLATDNGAHP